jgi:hypothetical protein
MTNALHHLEQRMGNSENTWMELLNLIGITNEQELREYIENNKEP